jgi:enterochelin esterase-like enzyme
MEFMNKRADGKPHHDYKAESVFHSNQYDPTDIAAFEKLWFDPIREELAPTTTALYAQPSRNEPGAQGSYRLYLPPAYEAEPERRFPVIYWLHGGNSNSAQGSFAAERIDGAIRAGKMPPVILVAPQALPVGWYVDSRDGSRPIEQVLVHDFVAHVDSTYRTIPEASARTLEGQSMGGYGSLHLGLKYPRLFGRISAIAPSMLRDMSLEPDERVANTFFGDQEYFTAVSPWTLLRANAPELRRLSRIRLLAGLADERLVPAAREFAAIAKEIDVPLEYREVDGAGHGYQEIVDPLGDAYFAWWQS